MQSDKIVVLNDEKLYQQYSEAIKLMSNVSGRYRDCCLMLGVWSKNTDLSKICQYVVEWRLPTSLFLQYNNCPTILKDIANINFPFLTKLFLRSNRIETIEVVSHFNMPCLRKAWFGNNLICSIKSLRKGYFPHLEQLTLCCNLLNELESLDQLHSPCLAHLDLQRSETDDRNRFITLKILAKVESSSDKFNFWGLNRTRIKQRNLGECLKRKYRESKMFGDI